LANSFWQRKKRIKDITHFCFQGLEKPENLRKPFAKEEEEEDVQRDSKVVKEYVEKLFLKVVGFFKCKSRSCFYRLFKSGQENHWKSYNL